MTDARPRKHTTEAQDTRACAGAHPPAQGIPVQIHRQVGPPQHPLDATSTGKAGTTGQPHHLLLSSLYGLSRSGGPDSDHLLISTGRTITISLAASVMYGGYVSIHVTNVQMPNHCDAGTYHLSTHQCQAAGGSGAMACQVCLLRLLQGLRCVFVFGPVV